MGRVKLHAGNHYDKGEGTLYGMLRNAQAVKGAVRLCSWQCLSCHAASHLVLLLLLGAQRLPLLVGALGGLRLGHALLCRGAGEQRSAMWKERL